MMGFPIEIVMNIMELAKPPDAPDPAWEIKGGVEREFVCKIKGEFAERAGSECFLQTIHSGILSGRFRGFHVP